MKHNFVDVIDFGAVGDSQTLNTQALQNAIHACFAAGGGTVSFPPGVYRTGTIELLSNVTLDLSAGASLLGSADINDYPKTPYKSEGRNTALIMAVDAQNIAVTGRGSINGNGTSFMNPQSPYEFIDFETHYIRQGDAYLKRPLHDGPVAMKDRPGILMVFINCTNLMVRDITILDAPNWCLHLAGCEHADILGVDILNSLLIPNAGGMDVSNSRNVNIDNCDIEAGDDGIAFSPCADGFCSKPCENITVSNCVIVSRSAAIRLGWGENDIRNLVFQNLIIRDSNRAICLCVRGSETIENVLFSNIVIETRLLDGLWWGSAEPIHLSVIEMTDTPASGTIRNVHFSNIIAESEHGMVLYSHYPGAIHDVTFRDVKLKIRAGSQTLNSGGNLDLRPAFNRGYAIFQHDIPGLYAHGINDLRIRGFDLEWGDALPEFFSHGLEIEQFRNLEIEAFRGNQALPSRPSTAAIALSEGSEVSIHNCQAEPMAGPFLSAKNVTGQRVFASPAVTEARETF